LRRIATYVTLPLARGEESREGWERERVVSGIESFLIGLIQHWYLTTGYFGIMLAMALESCCIPLPSEIVMPLAGYFVYQSTINSTGRFSLVWVAIIGAIGCVLGSAIAYVIGATGGRPLLLRYGRYILISKADSDRADRWFRRHGSSVAFFSRLMPIVRTYISLPAGISEMPFGRFLLFTFLGSLPWCLLLAYIGVLLAPAVGNDPTAIPDKLGGVFHGLDVVVALVLVAAVAYYIYRHIQHDKAARAAEEPRLPARR
jgi:membrane protein DedA with SNARE-associated domain